MLKEIITVIHRTVRITSNIILLLLQKKLKGNKNNLSINLNKISLLYTFNFLKFSKSSRLEFHHLKQFIVISTSS